MKKFCLALVVIGIIFFVIAPLWMFIIAPSQLMIPEDVSESITYTGEASVANPQDLSQLAGPFNLTIEREYRGIDTIKNGQVIIINETAKVTIESPFTPVEEQSYLMAVNRKTCEHLNEDGASWDHARTGQFTFGFHPEKKDRKFWLHDINDTVTAEYDGTTKYEGLNVIKYSMKGDIPVTNNEELVTQYAGLTYYYGNSILNTLYLKEDTTVYVDDTTGMIVYLDRTTEFYGEVFNLQTNTTHSITYSQLSYKFDDETAERLVKDAKNAAFSMGMVENNLPILFLVIGIGFIATSYALNVHAHRLAERETEEANVNQYK